MPRLRWKRRFDPASLARIGLVASAAVIAGLLTMVCGSVHANAETPALTASGPSTFRGEIANGLKIEMKLYQDGPSLHGTYSYDAFGRDIQLKGTINKQGEFVLREFVKGNLTGNFQGKFVTMDRVEGKWFKKSPNEKGRSFYVVRTGAHLAATQVSATPEPSKADREAAPSTKETRSVPKPEAMTKAAPDTKETRSVPIADATGKAAPNTKETRSVPKPEATARPALMTGETHQQAASNVKQSSVPAVTREVPVAQVQNKPESKTQPVEQASVSPQQPLKIDPAQQPSTEEMASRPKAVEESPKVLPRADVQPEEKSHIVGRAVDSAQKKGSSSWADFFFNLKVGGAIGGILLLGGGLAWLAIVAGGAAAFRENSALFRQAHAMGISFLPGILLLALGVGAVLAVFVE